ncbi:hypothetical protein GCM10027081_00740 [Cupriavidus yeoncheonensis]
MGLPRRRESVRHQRQVEYENIATLLDVEECRLAVQREVADHRCQGVTQRLSILHDRADWPEDRKLAAFTHPQSEVLNAGGGRRHFQEFADCISRNQGICTIKCAGRNASLAQEQ